MPAEVDRAAYDARVREIETAVLAHERAATGAPVFSEDRARRIRVTRVAAGGGPDVFVGEGEVAMAPIECIRAIEDDSRLLEWDPAHDLTEDKVVWETADGYKTHLYHNVHKGALGGLVSARELTNVRALRTLPDGSVHSVFASIDEPVLFPPLPGVVRAHNHPSGMIIQRTAAGGSRFVFVLHMDVRGSIPNWVVRGAIAQQVIDAIAFLQKVASERAAPPA